MNNQNHSCVLDFTAIAKLCCALLSIAVLLSSPVLADTHVWVGNTDVNLATGGNWQGGTAPAGGDAWQFGVAGSSGYTLTNNYGAGTYNSGIVFTENAKGAYTISGSWTRQTGDIVNNSSYAQTLNMGHELQANIAINAANGDINILKNNSINLNGKTLTVKGNKNTTISLTISGDSGAIVKEGTGTLTLNGSSIFDGGITVKGGGLTLSKSNSAGGGKITLGTGADDVKLTLQQGKQGAKITNTIEVSATGTGNVTILGNSQWTSHSGSLVLNRKTTLAIPTGTGSDWWYGFENISGSGDIIAQAGIGSSTRMSLSGSSYKGNIYVENGLIQLNSSIGSGDIILGTSNTGTRQAGVRFGFNSSNDIIVSSDAPKSNATINSYNGLQTLTGNLTLNSNVTIYGLSDRLTWDIPSKWSGTGDITISGGRVTTFVDATDWTGNVTINKNSIFQPGTSKSMNKNNSVINNGTFQLCNQSSTINGLSGSGTVQIVAASSPLSLTIGAGGATSTFSGTIVDGAKVLSIIKAGTGTLTLSGTNTYTGGTTISAGVLKLSNDSAAGNASKTITLGDANTGSNDVQLIMNAKSVKNPVVVSNQGTGKVTITGNYQYGDVSSLAVNRDTILNSEGASGTDWWFSFSKMTGTGDVTMQGPTGSGQRLTIYNSTAFEGDVVVESGNVQVSLSAGKGSMTIGNANTGTQTAKLILYSCNPSKITISSAADEGATLILTPYSATMDISTSLQIDHDLTFIGGSDRLTFTGGTWSGEGDVIVNSGRVSSDANVSAWTGNVIVNSGAKFQTNRTVAITKNNSIKLNNSTFQIFQQSVEMNGLEGSGTVQVIQSTNDFSLTIGAGNATSEFSGNIINGNASSLKIIKAGTGTLTLSGSNNTYTGGTLISGGTLKLTDTGTLGTGSVNISTGATLDFDIETGTKKFTNQITGSGTISKNGAGTLQLLGTQDEPILAQDLQLVDGRLDMKGYYSGNMTAMENSIFSPGNSVGQVNVDGNVSFNAGSTLLIEQDATGIDQLIIGSGHTLTFDDDAILQLAMGAAIPNAGSSIITLADGFKGDLASLEFWNSHLSPESGYYWNLSFSADMTQLMAHIDPNAVPEPSTWALLILGSIGMYFMRRRKAKK